MEVLCHGKWQRKKCSHDGDVCGGRSSQGRLGVSPMVARLHQPMDWPRLHQSLVVWGQRDCTSLRWISHGCGCISRWYGCDYISRLVLVATTSVVLLGCDCISRW